MRLSRPELEELERLNREATPGPWHWEDRPGHNGPFVPQGSFLGETLITLGDTYENSTEDCFLLAGLRNNATALLESASFAERALELLRSMDQVAKETDDCPCCATLRVYPNFPNTDNCETEHEPGCALAELLRSLPAQPAKEKPDAP